MGAEKTASSRGRGLLKEKQKMKDEMGVGGKGKMPTGINCSMVVVVNDDLWNFLYSIVGLVNAGL